MIRRATTEGWGLFALTAAILLSPTGLGNGPGGSGYHGVHLGLPLGVLAPTAGPPHAATAASPPTSAAARAAAHVAAGPAWDWWDLSSNESVQPSGRVYAAATYDPVDGYVLLYGGYAFYDDSDTWAYSNDSWGQLNPTGSPPALDGASLAWDSRDGYALLYGGGTSSSVTNSEWTYVRDTWTQRNATNGPGDLANAVMAYDPHLSAVVLFGGRSPTGSLSDATWEYRGGSWANVTATPSPPASDYASMVYDPVDGYLVLFGGAGLPVADQNATWAFDGSWTELAPTLHPPPRYSAQMAWDRLGNFALLYGGTTGPTFLNDTWEFVGGQWLPIATSRSPGTRGMGMEVDDAGDGLVVVFSGWPSNTASWTQDTWVFTGGLSVATPPPYVTEVGVVTRLNASVEGGVPPYRFAWTSGGNLLGSGAVLSDSFSSPGNLTLALSVLDLTGGSGHTAVSVDVSPRLTVSVASNRSRADLDQSLNLSVHFTGGVGPVSVNWSWPNMTTGVAGSSATVLAGVAGNLTVTAQANDSLNVSAVARITVPVAQDPAPVLLSGGRGLQATIATTLRASVSGGWPPYTFQWSMGNGATGTGANETYAYPSAGSFRLTLSVSDSAGDSGRVAYEVTVSPAPSPRPAASSFGGLTELELGIVAGAVIAVVAAGAALVLRRRRAGR